ncbi:MAG: hypothetical protein QOF48_1632 [Verrucomicrobiota bacterium]|jgi:hypothetical protein
MKTLLTLFFFSGLLIARGADAPKRCVICGLPLGATFYYVTSPTLAEKQAVCAACSKLKDHCSICRLPLPAANARKLEDGRLFCERDFRAGVFELKDARRIYEAVRRDVAGILSGYGILPERNITVALAGGSELKKLQLTLPSEHDGEGLLGLTRTESTGRKQFQHHILLLTGLPKDRLSAVCAHEYTHTWLHENIPADRKLEKDTVEGFCELIAYKLMVQRHEELQRKIILENAYTRGQVNALVEAENQHNFHRIVKWVQTGVDVALFETNKVQALTLRDDTDDAGPVWPPPTAIPTRVPNSLTLKGISGTAARRFALINDATLVKNEEAKVRVGSSNVFVRCLEIHPRSVWIQIRGAVAPMELVLTNND